MIGGPGKEFRSSGVQEGEAPLSELGSAESGFRNAEFRISGGKTLLGEERELIFAAS
jgi:hypothetical protein